MKQKTKYLILILLAICLEYYRDYLFININFQIDFLDNSVNNLDQFNNTDSNIHSFIHNLDISKLKSIKWILSIIFSLLYFLIGIIFSKCFFSNSLHKSFSIIYSVGGAVILSFSYLIFVFGKHLNLENQTNFYFVSLELSHYIQSSLYPITFLLIFYSINIKKI